MAAPLHSLSKVGIERQAAPYSQEPQSPLVLGRLLGGEKLPVIAALFLRGIGEKESILVISKGGRKSIRMCVMNFCFQK